MKKNSLVTVATLLFATKLWCYFSPIAASMPWIMAAQADNLTSPKNDNLPSAKFANLAKLEKFAGEKRTAANVVYESWVDSKRNRTLPIKIYLPESGTAPFPTVIFSHGLGGSVEAAAYLGTYLSHHGFLCIFVQHPGSDTAVWEPYKTQGREAIVTHMKLAANPQNLIDRGGDISFVLDELEKRNQNDKVLGHKVDLKNIACAGHSFGAGTTLAIAGQVFNLGNLQDKRIKSAMYLCPPVNINRMVLGKTYASITVPGLLLTGTEDTSPIGDTKAEDRRIPYDEIKAPHQYLVNIVGANHATFGGGRKFVDDQNSDAYHEMICKVAGEFLDATLKNDPVAWKWLDSSEAPDYFGKKARYERK